METKNYGIMASIDWNSNKWQGLPTEEDRKNGDTASMNGNGISYTCLNFAHEIYPPDDYGYYWGLLPQLNNKMPEPAQTKHLEIVFIMSKNWETKENYIVGLYAFPALAKTKRPSPFSEYPIFDMNIKALPKHIHLLENYLNLDTHPQKKDLLSNEKQIGKQGFTFLKKKNVLAILDALTELNKSDVKLHSIKYSMLKKIGLYKV